MLRERFKLTEETFYINSNGTYLYLSLIPNPLSDLSYLVEMVSAY